MSARRRGSASVARLAPVLFLALSLAAAEAPPATAFRPATGIYGAAALQGLAAALTFHLSFDAGSFVPDLAAGGKWSPAVHPAAGGAPEFAPGLAGQALVLGSGAAVFPSAGNIPFQRCGAIALWVKPLEWKRPNGDNSEFLMTSDCLFYLQRQGPMLGVDGSIRRHESVQYLAKSSSADRQYTGLADGAWENGRWRFIVANWSWPQMQLSIDGGPFAVQALPARPVDGVFAAFIVGASGGERGLLDEVMAFKRPLTLDEIRALRAACPRPPSVTPTPTDHR